MVLGIPSGLQAGWQWRVCDAELLKRIIHDIHVAEKGWWLGGVHHA